jgi:hypothetical protein
MRSTVAQLLVEEVIVRFGTPYVIHTDQGVQFENNLFQVCRLLQIQKTRTTLLITEICLFPPLVSGNSQRMSIAMRSIGNPVSILCIGALFLLYGGIFCEQNE